MKPLLCRLAIGLASLAACGNLAAVEAGDCFRQMGIGYSAGYHAPGPLTHSSTASKFGGWLHWKSACCQPGTPPGGCGCEAIAPCGPPCAAGCGLHPSLLPPNFYGPQPCGTCCSANAGIY